MKKYLIAILILSAAVTLAGVTQMMQQIVARKRVASGVVLIFEENFDGPGEENAWDHTNDPESGLDDQNTTQKVNGSYSLYVDGQSVSGTNHYWFIDLGVDATRTSVYFRVDVKSGGAGTDVNCSFDSNGTGPGSRDLGNVQNAYSVDGDYNIYTDPSSYLTLADFGTDWLCVEWHYPTGVVRTNGVFAVDNADDATVQALRYIIIGGDDSAGQNGNQWIDAIAISTEGWIGVVP